MERQKSFEINPRKIFPGGGLFANMLLVTSADPESFIRGGLTLTALFSVDGGGGGGR